MGLEPIHPLGIPEVTSSRGSRHSCGDGAGLKALFTSAGFPAVQEKGHQCTGESDAAKYSSTSQDGLFEPIKRENNTPVSLQMDTKSCFPCTKMNLVFNKGTLITTIREKK